MTASLRPSIAGGRTRYSGAIYTGRQQSSQSRWTGNPSEARWRRQLLTTLTHNRYLVEAQARAGLSTYAVYGGRSHAGERKGSSSHSGDREWRGSGVLSISGASSLLHLDRAAPGQRENTETVAKLPQPAQPRYNARGARPDDHVVTNN